MYSKIKSSDQQKVKLNDQILNNLLKRVSIGRVSELSNDMGLPYGLVYNLVHGRIKSLSAENYKLIFGEEPPDQAIKRVDGEYFRGMVRLWLYLNDNVTEAELYREFHRDKKIKKIDYRIFGGFTKTVDKKLEREMEQKIFAHGFNRAEIRTSIKELGSIGDEDRISYKEMKPILGYLEKNLRVNPTRILNQSSARYEGGELKTVSKKVFNYALKLKKRTENALNTGSKFEVEKIWEEISGKRKGFTLYSEIEEELDFLKYYGGISLKKYLRRSTSYYKESRLKRIASWRVQNIKDACTELINNKPELALASLPKSYARMRITKLLSVLKSHLFARLKRDEDGIERLILTSAYYSKKEYKKENCGFININKTAYFLGMNKIAFDLLVAANSDLFRKIMTYDKEWYFSYQYLKNLKKKEGFDLIKTKYEVLAKDYEELNRPEERKRQSVHVSNEKTLRNMEKVKQECIVENLHPDLSSGFSFN
jgi:hypothetical protein